MESEEMETFGLFRLRFRWAYDSAYESDFRFSQGHKLSYDSEYDSDSVASEKQALVNSRVMLMTALVTRNNLILVVPNLIKVGCNFLSRHYC